MFTREHHTVYDSSDEPDVYTFLGPTPTGRRPRGDTKHMALHSPDLSQMSCVGLGAVTPEPSTSGGETS